MKCIVVFNLLFLLGVSQAQFGINEETDLATATQLEFAESFQIQGKRKAFRRIARSVFSFGQDPKTIVENAIINNCKANGQNEAAEKLQDESERMDQYKTGDTRRQNIVFELIMPCANVADLINTGCSRFKFLTKAYLEKK